MRKHRCIYRSRDEHRERRERDGWMEKMRREVRNMGVCMKIMTIAERRGSGTKIGRER